MSKTSNAPLVAVIGAGSAGLMVAEVLSHNGVRMEVFDAMPSAERKFLLTDIDGINITHSEPLDAFLGRCHTRREALAPLIDHFSPDALRVWIRGLGIDTFVGNSGRVFLTETRATPLLRAWLRRLRESGVQLHMQHRWVRWAEPSDHAQVLRFEAVGVEWLVRAGAVILAMGGDGWPCLGSDDAWVLPLEAHGVQVQPLQSANCGSDIGWSAYFQERLAGQSARSVAVGLRSAGGGALQLRQSEFAVMQTGIEGSLVYALSVPIRDVLTAEGSAAIWLDLAPGWSMQRVADELTRPCGARLISSYLQSRLNIADVKLGLLRECLSKEVSADLAQLAKAIKALPLRLTRTRLIEETINTAGGATFETLDTKLTIERLPGVSCADEMLDWEVPTGGYLLTTYFASGAAAGQDAFSYLARMTR